MATAHAAAKYTLNDQVKARSLTGNSKLVVYTGIVEDNKFGEGTVVIRSRPSKTQGVLNQVSVAYFKNGSITLKGTTESSTSASGSITYKGSAKATAGTGAFKHVSGNIKIYGAASSADPTLANLTVKGTLTY
jgi:hypothetical protein